jgi:ABC-type transport system involved in cytochrome c biogenesis permease subunit
MKRHWNWTIWVGFAIALLAVLSYIPLFVRFASTRDLPWANLLLFLLAGSFLAIGLRRAFAQPERYRGKISGAILAVLSLAICVFFCYGVFYGARIPYATGAPRIGDQAPDFALTASDGRPVSLSQLRQGHRAVLLIFYRGYW